MTKHTFDRHCDNRNITECDMMTQLDMQMYILTIVGCLCVHFTPLPHSRSRHCSHSNIVCSTTKKCRQKGRSCIRLSAHSIVLPGQRSITSVFNMILRVICNILESSPGHIQSWFPLFHGFRYRNTSDFRKD